MSPAALLAMGLLVTLVYGAGLALLVYGAVLDGRDEARRKAEEAERAAVNLRPYAVSDDTTTEAGDVPAAA